MKHLNTYSTLLATGLLAFSSYSFAAPIVTFTLSEAGNAGDLDSVNATRDEFLGRLHDGAITENFDGFAALTQANGLATAVGTFSIATTGTGLCASGAYAHGCSAVAVLDAGSSVYSGRYTTDGGKWLDSMDAKILDIALADGFNSIGFYLTDAQDMKGAQFTFTITSGGVDIEFGTLLGDARLADGNLHYVSFTSKEAVTNLRIASNHAGDGFGIYGVTIGNNPRPPVASVPEPATLAMLGLGLLGTHLSRRRRSA